MNLFSVIVNYNTTSLSTDLRTSAGETKMITRFNPVLKTAIATTMLLMFTVAIVSGQARANLKQALLVPQFP